MTGTVLGSSKTRPTEAAATLSAGSIRMELTRYQTFVGSHPVTLTFQEFELLKLFLINKGRIVAYDELLRGLWGKASGHARRRLGVVVCRLRAKLGASGTFRIQTVRGRGYGLTQYESSEE